MASTFEEPIIAVIRLVEFQYRTVLEPLELQTVASSNGLRIGAAGGGSAGREPEYAIADLTPPRRSASADRSSLSVSREFGLEREFLHWV